MTLSTVRIAPLVVSTTPDTTPDCVDASTMLQMELSMPVTAAAGSSHFHVSFSLVIRLFTNSVNQFRIVTAHLSSVARMAGFTTVLNVAFQLPSMIGPPTTITDCMAAPPRLAAMSPSPPPHSFAVTSAPANVSEFPTTASPPSRMTLKSLGLTDT